MRDTMNIHNDNYQNDSVVIFFFQYDTLYFCMLPALNTWNAKNVELYFFRIQNTSLRSGEK